MLGKKQQKVTNKEINSTLKNIYSDEKGKMIDMKVKKMQIRKGAGWRKMLVGLIVFFALIFAVSWMGVFVFSKFGAESADNLELDIAGSKKVTAGEFVEYTLKYKNKEDFPLASSEIALYLPKSFILEEATPVLDDKNKLKIGTLKSGEGGSIKFKGKFFAIEGSKEVIQAVLTYKPSNFNSNFQKVYNLEVEINGSVFDGSLEGPDVSVVGDDISYSMTYKNKSGEDLVRIAIDAVLPNDFIISTSTPTISNNNRWEIGKLKAKSDGEVKIKGAYGSEANGSKDIIFKLGIIDEDGAFFPLIEKQVTTDIVGSDLLSKATINGADNLTSIGWGEGLNYTITYKNQGKNILYDVTLKMTIEGLPKEQGMSIVDWAGFSDLNGGIRKGDVLTWTKNEINGLAKIKPGDEGMINFTINAIPQPAKPSYSDYKIDSLLEINIKRVGEVVVDRNLQNKKITTFINSNVEFSSRARYYDENNNIIGSGPIPPKVGQKTTYKAYWKITNSMHELENIEVKGTLPKGVVFSNASANAGNINLDSTLKNIVWSLNRMPTSVNEISAEFELSITPGAESVGQVATLLEGIELSAKDRSTGGLIIIKQANEATLLLDDPYVTKGEVEG
ncbi:hypothetical protein L6259_03155 [Candidatus Parcubacteria bacterium]|nr:hypothetical protein [Patescibacteria group bacterium]MCG2694237.1 hypothetical protein [Candidatus Parcubacteria bacterium]